MRKNISKNVVERVLFLKILSSRVKIKIMVTNSHANASFFCKHLIEEKVWFQTSFNYFKISMNLNKAHRFVFCRLFSLQTGKIVCLKKSVHKKKNS